MRTLVLDTGPVVALLDATDPEHARSTEIMHLLERNTLGPRTVVKFVAASRLRIEGCGGLNTLIRSVSLMEKYADTPMDFADATLILLADARKTRQICTLDRRGFVTYRTLDRKRFTVIP